MFRRWTIEFKCLPGVKHGHNCSEQWIGSSRRFWTEQAAQREATVRNDGMDVDEFERAILHARDEYRRRLGVVPTVIDLPNWTRGTILEQIAFTNGFDIADPRKE